MKMLVVLVALFAFPSSLLAHHSDAGVDTQTEIWIEGEVVEFVYRNPHGYIVVNTRGPNGELTDWKVQTNGPFIMSRQGWSKETLKPGDQVSVRLNPARNDRPYGFMRELLVNGLPPEGIQAAEARSYVPAIADSLEGVWQGDRSTIGDITEFFDRIVPTEKGRLAKANFDPQSDRNPIVNCIARPTPSSLASAGLFLSEFTFLDDGNIKLTNELFNVERLIYMDGRQHPPKDQRTLQGHSIGWWEGETLVVDTANFSDHLSPYQDGLPSGAEKHTLEKYRLTEDKTRMIIDLILDDSEFIAEPLVHQMQWIYSPQYKPSYYECDLGAARAFLPD